MSNKSSDRALLKERRATLETRLEEIRKDVGKRLSQDSSDRAIELENAEVLNEIARVAQEELIQINKKLDGLA